MIARSEREAGPFVVDIERFHGPLDLLLHLIRQQDIDILDIPIARITRQFLLAVERIHERDLDSAGEFLEMAAALVRIKAQLLLPRSGEDPEDDPRAELVRRLLEYEQIREISQRLSRTEADQARRFRKGLIPIRPRPSGDETPLETAWEEVFEAALGVVVSDPRDLEHRITTRSVSMEEKAALILDALEEATRIEFRRLVRPFTEKIHGVMTFLAGLELTRSHQVRLRQSHPFQELWVCRPDSETEGPTNGSSG